MVPSSVEESDCDEPNPAKRAVLLARKKAEDVFHQHSDAYVIGCDTLVVAEDGTLLEKPVDRKEAKEMIEMQRGHTSIVHSGLCVFAPGGESAEGLSSSSVLFKNLSDDEVQWWLDTDLWQDRSGSFQIDGKGQMMIERIEGDWPGIVGLPVYLLGELLKQVGYPGEF